MTSPTPSNEYMYTTAAEELEARRLQGLNDLHNPHTLKFLQRYLPGRKKILELGCGSGQLAAEVMKHADSNSHFIGIDRDPAQVQHCTNILKNNSSRVEVIKLDIVTELQQLREKGPFDLIYCRWVLVHLSNAIRIEVLRNIFSLLAENGVFLCDECDNRTVECKPIEPNKTTAPYREANKLWSELSHALMRLLKNDLELTPEKIQAAFLEASNNKGKVCVDGQYQVTFRGKEQKRLLTDSSKAPLIKIYGQEGESMIAIFDRCAADDNIEINFLTENVVSYHKP